MTARKEFDFAEVRVDRLFLESFANEQSPYYVGDDQSTSPSKFTKLRKRLQWHVNHTLSPRQKQVIRHYLSGKTERQIAQILGVTQQVVNIYKHRAIKKLHKTFVA